jgi:acyl-coenzyme A thioesterase PaaI-like protein
MNELKSLQEKYAPQSICFGCGPANEKGLKIRTFEDGEKSTISAPWYPKKEHQAFEGILNGGIIGALLDCHSNWTAAWWLMKSKNLDHPPCTVTADFHVKLLRPTPVDQPIVLKAKVEDSIDNQVKVSAELIANNKVCATCTGTFVAVKPGHPAYHRW